LVALQDEDRSIRDEKEEGGSEGSEEGGMSASRELIPALIER